MDTETEYIHIEHPVIDNENYKLACIRYIHTSDSKHWSSMSVVNDTEKKGIVAHGSSKW